MTPRPIPAPDLAALTRRTAWGVAAWFTAAALCSIVLQVIVGG